jgi:hypothetical protein
MSSNVTPITPPLYDAEGNLNLKVTIGQLIWALPHCTQNCIGFIAVAAKASALGQVPAGTPAGILASIASPTGRSSGLVI